jgi:hypothetical protein
VARKAISENRKCRFWVASLKLCIFVVLVLSVVPALYGGPLRGEFEQEAKAELERLDPFM